ncbi:MAG: AbrB/MazE/SpoVT family DNA-binding domain-containing protein [Candidatus Diapherotrites archaeon]|nr:AbrB/MazE/SpoVT family DNA-binding domain-containing protein [Candidatus Diapherotrites archaeon]
MSVTVMGERGQITIPKNIRDKEGLKPKDKVVVAIEDNRIILKKALSKKEKERMIKEYYTKYEWLEEKVAKEWEHVSKEADAMLDDY